MKALAAPMTAPAPPGYEYVMWQVQPGYVTLYVMASGNEYRVRNQFERVLIHQADRPELEKMGYIQPQE